MQANVVRFPARPSVETTPEFVEVERPTSYVLDMVAELEKLAAADGQLALAAMLGEVLRRHRHADPAPVKKKG